MKSLVPLPIRKSLGGAWSHWQTSRAQKKLLRDLSGDAVECNLCGWQGSAMTDDCWHPGTICPVCRSQVRHRILKACLDGLSTLAGVTEAELLAGREILHFAPERVLAPRFRQAASRYQTADFSRGDCDLQADMSHMPEIPSSSFDTFVACDVLEHVPDDAAAIREISRVLRPGGVAILTVPQKDPPAATDEDPSLQDETAREARFGQKDHVRMYGCDFQERLLSGHFHLLIADHSKFSPEIVSRHVLHPPILSRHPLATNHRRIYFAFKPPEKRCVPAGFTA